MLAVVDTNVWVSVFLSRGGTVAKLSGAFKNGLPVPVYSDEIEAEYRDVLTRSKFKFDPELVAEFFERLNAEGRRETAIPPLDLLLPDPDDVPFIALARHAACPVITGNARHFPPEAGVEVLSPGEWLGRLAGI